MVSLFSSTIHAEPKVGEPFPLMTLEDQFGIEQSINNTDRLLLMSFERDVSAAVHAFLEQQSDGFLVANNTKYISDISAMPGMITSLFALPKMRKYNYSLMLNRDKGFEEIYDVREGKLTVYHLNAGVIESIEFIDAASVSQLF